MNETCTAQHAINYVANFFSLVITSTLKQLTEKTTKLHQSNGTLYSPHAITFSHKSSKKHCIKKLDKLLNAKLSEVDKYNEAINKSEVKSPKQLTQFPDTTVK